MAILFDARGNEYVGQLDAIGGQTITDARSSVASLSVVNAETLVDLNGHATLVCDIRGTFVQTLVFEATIDGTNYLPVAAYNINTAMYVSSVTATNTVAMNVAGYRRARVRVSLFTSGTALVSLRASMADFATLIERVPATSGLSVTAAVGVAATLTLPAPGSGLYQYIDWIRFDHFAAALLTAGTTPVLVTTTNMPGTPTFNFRADAAPQGTLTEKIVQAGMPIRASAANTTVVITCPATTNVIWRVTASWRVGA